MHPPYGASDDAPDQILEYHEQPTIAGRDCSSLINRESSLEYPDTFSYSTLRKSLRVDVSTHDRLPRPSQFRKRLQV